MLEKGKDNVALSMSGSFGDDSNNGGCGSALIADQPIVSSQFSILNEQLFMVKVPFLPFFFIYKR
jgi:hypothetical protein